LRNLDTIYLEPDLVRISQPKLISGDHFFGLQRMVKVMDNYEVVVRQWCSGQRWLRQQQ
jgi:hypothetical protein